MVEYKFGFDCYNLDVDEKKSTTEADAGIWRDRENHCYVEIYAYTLEDAVKQVGEMIQRDRIEVSEIKEVRVK